MARKQKPPAFEQALKELETLVENMEAGELSLEASLKHYERGMQLSRLCQQALDEAEQRVRVLKGTGTQARAQAFEPDPN